MSADLVRRDDASSAPRRYFDNAATSFPKPPEVIEAVRTFMEGCGASPGRGAYRETIDASRMVARTRGAIRRLFGAASDDHVVFTHNGTDALNLAIRGVLRDGDHVVTTWLEHNSVLRPLHTLEEQRGVRWTAVRPDPRTTRLDVDALADAIRDDTRLVVLNHASNVTGALQPLAAIAELCRDRGVLLLVDAAQSAGHVPIDLSQTPVDLLATPGHKGLLGPPGTGVLVVRAGLGETMQTTREGGTGSASEQIEQPRELPDRLEAGTLNVAGIAGLGAGVGWLQERGVAAIRAGEQALCERMIETLAPASRSESGGLQLFGPHNAEQRVGVFSVRLDGYEPEELSAILEERYGLLTRAGLHCAPYAHKLIGTFEIGGATRLSFGHFTQIADLDLIRTAFAELSGIKS